MREKRHPEGAAAINDRDGGVGERAVRRGILAVKIVFALAFLHLWIPLMTEDMFERMIFPLPTWEWALYSLTPAILLFVARNSAHRSLVNRETGVLCVALLHYLVFATIWAVGGNALLWVAVGASVSGLAGLWAFRRGEHSVVR
ncbi:hypothetical protein ACFWMQ_06180 [Streptomyces sp. NPDC058372]|uniref:hypothetical protein n=1 Tax=unclassified Streptomyces TaxID=2593676 RepID=UPI00365E5849